MKLICILAFVAEATSFVLSPSAVKTKMSDPVFANLATEPTISKEGRIAADDDWVSDSFNQVEPTPVDDWFGTVSADFHPSKSPRGTKSEASSCEWFTEAMRSGVANPPKLHKTEIVSEVNWFDNAVPSQPAPKQAKAGLAGGTEWFTDAIPKEVHVASDASDSFDRAEPTLGGDWFGTASADFHPSKRPRRIKSDASSHEWFAEAMRSGVAEPPKQQNAKAVSKFDWFDNALPSQLAPKQPKAGLTGGTEWFTYAMLE